MSFNETKVGELLLNDFLESYRSEPCIQFSSRISAIFPQRLTYDQDGTEETRLQQLFILSGLNGLMRRIVEYEWQDALQDAVRERDPREIEGRVLRAEIAIFERVHSRSRVDSIEMQALFDALKALRLLRSSAHRATKFTFTPR